MAPELLAGRGTGLWDHSWQAAFVLDDFSLKICLEKSLLSKEGNALWSMDTCCFHLWMGPRRAERACHPPCYRLLFVQQEERLLDTIPNPATGQSPPGVAGFPCTLPVSVVCMEVCGLPQMYILCMLCFRHHTPELEMQKGIRYAFCAERVHGRLTRGVGVGGQKNTSM